MTYPRVTASAVLRRAVARDLAVFFVAALSAVSLPVAAYFMPPSVLRVVAAAVSFMGCALFAMDSAQVARQNLAHARMLEESYREEVVRRVLES